MSRATTEPTIPTARDAALARAASRVLDASTSDDRGLTMQIVEAGKECTALELPPAAARLLRTLLQEMAAGRAVTVVPLDAEITTGDAAELLHVSRPFVVGLIDKGELAARMVGAHRRLRLDDVLKYKRDSKVRARVALKEMVEISQELGLE